MIFQVKIRFYFHVEVLHAKECLLRLEQKETV